MGCLKKFSFRNPFVCPCVNAYVEGLNPQEPVSMTVQPSPSSVLSESDHEKLAQLRRIKWTATAVLVACFVLFLVARGAQDQYPNLAYVAAFAEAATIGGLADWYAVVVLFRYPMGIKVPHTAIIPNNQARIADNLGAFLESNFLSQQIVRAKLEEIDFASGMIDWLGDPARSRQLSGFAVQVVPDVLAAIEESGFKDFAAGKIAEQVQKTEIAPVATKLIDAFVADGRYQALLDEIVNAIDRVMHDEETLKSIQKKVGDELPTVLYVLQADSVILKRIVKVTGSLMSDVKQDPNHPLRQEFQELFESYVERMKTSRRFSRRVELFKKELIARPEIASLADRIWDNLGDYVARDARSDNPVLAEQLAGMMVGLARQIEKDSKLRAQINRGLVSTLTALIHENKAQVSQFVSDEVKSWDIQQLVRLIEANVGKDLQYIRFNGMLIGGIAGTILFMIEHFLFA